MLSAPNISSIIKAMNLPPFFQSAQLNLKLGAVLLILAIMISTMISGGVFSRPVKIKEVSVPLILEQHNLSCEIASLRMILAEQKIVLTEDQIIEKLTFDPTPKSVGIWGDPDYGFVGSLDGNPGEQGYGIYPEGLKKLAVIWLSNTYEKPHWKIEDIKASLDRGIPLIIWGISGSSEPMTWKTPNGKIIKANRGEHARVVYGYREFLFGQTEYELNDPEIGTLVWTQDHLLADWEKMDFKAIGFSK